MLTADRPVAPWRAEVDRVGRAVGVPMVAAVAVATAVTIAAGLLVVHVLDGSVGRFDLDVERDLAGGRTAFLDRVTAGGTVLAETVTVSLLWVGAMALLAWRTRRWAAPVFLLVAIGGEKLTYLLASIVVDRPRPPVATLGHVYATRSFPSGHVGAAVTLYGGLVALLLWWWARGGRQRRLVDVALWALAAGAAALVGFSRMYRGHHYPSDVAWGAVLGVAWLVFAWRVVLRDRPAPG